MTQVVAGADSAGARLRSPRAWAQLVGGLFGYGLAVVMMIQSRLGLGPWDAFHQGLSARAGISVGVASILTGAAVVALSFGIGIRPGVGTVANMVLIGWFIDLLHPWIPVATGAASAYAYFIAGIAVCGLSTGVYIAAGLGKGPRDGLMLQVAARSGWPVRRVRTLIELSALGVGWWLGGSVGVGTVLFALGIGPAAQWGLKVCGVHTGAPAATEP
jgi:uncharacterized membrane protein YczE